MLKLERYPPKKIQSSHLKACETLCVQRLILIYMRRHSSLFTLRGNSHKLHFSVKSLTLSCLICGLNLYFAKKLLREAKNCSRLLEPQNVAPKAKICPNVAKHNRDRRRYFFVGFCNFCRPKLDLVH